MEPQQLKDLLKPGAFPHATSDVQLLETHISWVLLAGEFAYKIKKPIQNSFLDYTTLAARTRYCEAELRLNARFAPELYLDVVPITSDDGVLRIAGSGRLLRWRFRMRRFSADALMSERLAHGLVTTQDVRSLAAHIAHFHLQAEQASPDSRFGSPAEIYQEALDNCRELCAVRLAFDSGDDLENIVSEIEQWTIEYFANHQRLFELRRQAGHVRECHGDLHLGNVVWWHGRYVPFDGIEFNDEFRWIDTLSDSAFTAMDLAALGFTGLSHSFFGATLETTGEYSAIQVFKWYMVFRAMVRAKVAALRAKQLGETEAGYFTSLQDLRRHLDLARQFCSQKPAQPKLWITHGVSGSGKTTGSERVVQQHGAIRVRADCERKRLGVSEADLYSAATTDRTYEQLAQIAEQLLRSGAHVIVDATFLKKSQRTRFRELARRQNVALSILHFEANPQPCASVSNNAPDKGSTFPMPTRLFSSGNSSHKSHSMTKSDSYAIIPVKCWLSLGGVR